MILSVQQFINEGPDLLEEGTFFKTVFNMFLSVVHRRGVLAVFEYSDRDPNLIILPQTRNSIVKQKRGKVR